MATAKATADDMVGGTFSRLMKTATQLCWQYETRDQSTVYLAYFHSLSAPNLPFRRVHMVGLDSRAQYKLDEDNSLYCGDVLMQLGMPLPYVTTNPMNDHARYMDKGDFTSHVFVLKKVAP